MELKSEQDGLKLSLMLICPEEKPRAIVQLAHGKCEHKERYEPFMNYLAERGCACVINDHRGHGASVRDPKDLGYFYVKNGDRALTGDLHQITLWARKKWPGIPLFLFGHSMGSLAVRAYCADHDGDIDSLVVCGSPGENGAAGIGLMLVRLLTLLRGGRHRSELISKLTTGGFSSQAESEFSGSWLSANPENAAAFAADPLCDFEFTLNGFEALMKLMIRAYDPGSGKKGGQISRGNPDLPIHFYSGEDDICAPDRAGFENAMNRMRQAGYTNVSGHMFPGLRHEILNEINREEVFERIWRESFEPYI